MVRTALVATVAFFCLAQTAGAHSRGYYISEQQIKQAFEDDDLTWNSGRREQVLSLFCMGQGVPHVRGLDVFDQPLKVYKHFECIVQARRHKYLDIKVHILPLSRDGHWTYTWLVI